ncbi:uncharacterized protein LOC126249801 [Schistocerca nitens]|uniref:uncharacterized protein LOC126249801 n=1 Tax=Schistocerca nitens TaxID=7011 RepID=UPI0021192AB1|nr:uncharacterized protein LOC126249801 [Schistocerca nitens]
MRRAWLVVSAALWLCLWAPAPALSQEAEAEAATEAETEAEAEAEADAEVDTTVSVQVVEENWTIVLQPRCCSDCTFVSRGFKCKVKSCLSNCPWARSSATPSAVPLF